MKKTLNLAILAAACLLSACSYFDKSEEIDVSAAQPAGQTIDLTTGAPADPIESQVLAPVEYRDVAEVIRDSSGGSVEIFSLDDEIYDDSQTTGNNDGFSDNGGAISVAPVDAVATYEQGQLNRYPGVEIFPLDDRMAAAMGPRSVAYPVPAPIGPSLLTPFPGEGNNAGGRGSDFVSVGLPSGNPAVIYFAHDSILLSQRDLMEISNLAKGYHGGSSPSVSVAGHASVQSSITDPVQRKIVNLKISMDRAFAVARALIESGVPPESIETRAYGEVKPPLPSDKPVDVASRRVEVYGVSVQ